MHTVAVCWRFHLVVRSRGSASSVTACLKLLETDVDPALKKANGCAKNQRFFPFYLYGVAVGMWV